MRRLTVFALLALAACDSPEVKDCESALLGGLRSPATYQRVSEELTETPERAYVTITYDAQNAYGALIRSEFRCQFGANEGGRRQITDTFSGSVEENLRKLNEISGLRP